jgi:hypothetical protein
MRRIARSAAIAAPFIVILSLASVGFAEEQDPLDPASSNAHAVDLNVDALGLGPDQGPVADAASLTSGVAVSLAGVTGSGPSAISGNGAAGNWLAEPIKG